MDELLNAVNERWGSYIATSDFQKTYARWHSNPDTREVLDVVREACYSARFTKIDPTTALVEKGFHEGVYAFYRLMDSIKPLPSQAQMPELDYGAKDEEKKQKDKE